MQADITEFKMRIASLEQAILAKHPTMPTLLQEIHKTLKLQPENVTLLSEDDIKIIVSGLEVQTQTFLAKDAVSKSKSTAASKSIASKLATLGADAV